MMGLKRDSRSDVGASKRDMETAALAGATFPKTDFTTGAAGRQQGSIASLLSHGAENAITLRDLVTLTGWNERKVRRQIQVERKAGTLILSDNSCGYFLPGDLDDLRRFYRSMTHRAAEIMSAARMAESAYLESLGQEKIAGW